MEPSNKEMMVMLAAVMAAGAITVGVWTWIRLLSAIAKWL